MELKVWERRLAMSAGIDKGEQIPTDDVGLKFYSLSNFLRGLVILYLISPLLIFVLLIPTK